MAAEWYYSKGDQRIGPVSESDLKSLAESGQLTAEDLVRQEGLADWQPASKISGLFPSTPTTTSTSVPPPLPQSSEAAHAEAPAVGADFALNAKKQMNRAAAAMSTFMSTAKSAAQLAAKQTEKTKLTTITLRSVYRPLGKHCYESQEYRADFPDLFGQLDAIQNELATLVARQTDKPSSTQSFGDKTKAMAGNVMQAAQSQKLSMQQSSLFNVLGKAVYERHQEASGPSTVTAPIAACLSRLVAIEADISTLSSEGKGSWITPKRLAIVGTVAACLLVTVAIGKVIPGVKTTVAGGSSSTKKSSVSGDRQGDNSHTTGETPSSNSLVSSQLPSSDFSQADYTFDFSHVNYTPVDFSRLDYTKGPNGEVIQKISDIDPMKTQSGFVKSGGVARDQAKSSLLPQKELHKARKSGTFVPHGLRWVRFDKNEMKTTTPGTERRNEEKGLPLVPIKMTDHWFNGELHGKVTEWNQQGKLVGELYKVHGKGYGRRVGYWPNGKTKLEDWWYDDKPHGVQKGWHENGQQAVEGTYVEGMEHGKWTYWHDNGAQSHQQAFIRGVKHGVFITYDVNGKKKKQSTFMNGKEVVAKQNSQSMIKPDFILTANELLSNYLIDDTAADRKFKGKKLKVGGTVYLVLDFPGIVGGPHFSFHNPRPNPDSVSCVFDSKKGLEPFETGQPATVTGTCDGVLRGSTGGIIVVLRDCQPSEAGADDSSDENEMPLPPVAGRKLKCKVNTVGIENMAWWTQRHNGSIKAMTCHATADELVIDLDVDTSQWVAVQLTFPLLVRVFDRNGQYLTHFTTAEKFTVFPEVYEQNAMHHKSFMNAGMATEAAKYKCILLKPKNNRLVYNVNVRDLRDASHAEIGFTD